MKNSTLLKIIREEIQNVINNDAIYNTMLDIDHKQFISDLLDTAMTNPNMTIVNFVNQYDNNQNDIMEETYAGKTAVGDMQKDTKYPTLSSTGKVDAVNALKKGETVTLEEEELDEMARAKVIYNLVSAEKPNLQKVIDAAKGNTKLALQYLLDNGELSIADLAKDLKKDPATFNNPSFRKLMADLADKGITKTDANFAEKSPKTPTPKAEKPVSVTPKSEKPKSTKSTDDSEESDFEQEAPSEKDVAAAEKEFGTTGAEKLGGEEKAKFEKLNKAIIAKVTKLEKMPMSQRSKSLDMSVLKQIIAKPEIIKLFKSRGINVKDLVSSVIA